MQVPQWAKNGEGSFWQRNYELASVIEQTCEHAIEEQLQNWLKELDLRDGPAAKDED